MDFSTFKNFSFRERLKVQFRAEFFNVMNHPNFAAPNFLNDANNSIDTQNAGVIGSTSTPSRQVQLGLKLRLGSLILRPGEAATQLWPLLLS